MPEDSDRNDPLTPVERLKDFARTPDHRIQEFLGARPISHLGERGTRFAVWAPAATAVAVVGDFNGWEAGRHPLRRRESGVWEGFVGGVGSGSLYKYDIRAPDPGSGEELRLEKADPVGFGMELRPRTASVVRDLGEFEWTDDAWLAERGERRRGDRPVSIYEVHVGSWRRGEGDGTHGWLTYRELADRLLPHVRDLGFTDLELLPITEHPYDPSWGYQSIGYFAPTARYGDPDDLRFFVDRAHALGLGVFLDWVPAHFPKDPHGLSRFDGTHLYEHEDPRRGHHPDWGTAIWDYGKTEVISFLVSSALFWLEEFHIDGLRVDAVASMLYLDYSRGEGEWEPNIHGGPENLEAVDFLQTLTRMIHENRPDVLLMAEESTAWPGITRPTEDGGLGFDMKWNMGWMNDTLAVMQTPPERRAKLHQKLTFSLQYAFGENYLLPLSHDEVVHLKRSLLSKMPGDGDDRFANLRLLLGYMWAHPGKKLLFMGAELGQWAEWDHDAELDWALAEQPAHAGLGRWIRDLNGLYRRETALHALDFSDRGFEWLDVHDARRSVISFIRWAPDWDDFVLVLANFSARPWEGYELGAPAPGPYDIVLRSDDPRYTGDEAPDAPQQRLEASEPPAHARPVSMRVDLPPYGVMFLRRGQVASDGA